MLLSRSPHVRIALGACVLVLCVLFSGSSEVESAGKNLLANPGMEEGLEDHPWMPAGWDSSVSGMPSVFFGRDTFLVHSGNYAISVANVSTVLQMAHNWSQTLVVDPKDWGKDAVFSMWTRSNGVEGRGYILIQAYQDTVTRMSKEWNIDREAALERLGINKIDDPILDLGWKREFFSDANTEWVRREVRIFIPPSTSVIFIRGGLMGTGQVIFDDASLTYEKAQPAAELPLNTNLLRDPSFEGDGDDWEYSIPPFLDMHVSQVDTYARTGEKSIGAWGGMKTMLNARAGVCQVLSNRNLAGKRVRLTSHVKADSLKGLAYIMVYAHTVGGMKLRPTPRQLSGTFDWTELTLEFDLPKDTYSVWAWSMYNAPAPGRVYFDDMELVVLGPSEQP